MNGIAVRGALVAVLAALAGACGSATGPTTDLILAGTWSGDLGAGSGGGRALRVTWTISQDGTQLSGPVTVSTSPAGILAIDGTMDVTFAGCDELRVEPPNSNHVRLTKR